MFDVVFDKLKVIFLCNSACTNAGQHVARCSNADDTNCIEIKLNNKQILLLKETHANFQEVMDIVHSINGDERVHRPTNGDERVHRPTNGIGCPINEK